ncbi:retron-type reverse transcriptase [Bradyrhizobium japonicum]
MTTTITTNKPFHIDKKRVYEAYKAVKSNAGSAGVDGQTTEQFDSDLQNNLYKLWNRMSSGSYFPPPVRAVSIPKKAGGQRILGVPAVADRVAQMVVKQLIEPDLDPIFLADSYGYRPRKSALDAIGVTRKRCWKYDWVLEFDIKGLFDNIDHELLLRAVRKHVTCKWALLYIERWLTAPMDKDGITIERTRGTPQGGVISPILSNLFLHYMRAAIRDLNLRRRTHVSMADIARQLNPLLRGWIEYYGRFTRAALGPILRYVNQTIEAWMMRKFKRFMGRKAKAGRVLERLSRERPGLFAHWKIGIRGSFA